MNGNVSGEGSPPMQAHLNHGPLGEQGRTCFPARGMSIMIHSSGNNGLVNYVEEEGTHVSPRTSREALPLEPLDFDMDIHRSHSSALWSPSHQFPRELSHVEYGDDSCIIPEEGDDCGDASVTGREDVIHIRNQTVGFDVASNERDIPSSPVVNYGLGAHYFDEPREVVPFEYEEIQEEKGDGDNREVLE